MKLTTAPNKAAIAVAATYQSPAISTKKINELKSTIIAVKEANWERRQATITGSRKFPFINRSQTLKPNAGCVVMRARVLFDQDLFGRTFATFGQIFFA